MMDIERSYKNRPQHSRTEKGNKKYDENIWGKDMLPKLEKELYS